MSANVPISVRTKRIPFIDDIPMEGINYSAAAFAMQIRQRAGDTTTPIVSLVSAAAGTQGISATYNAGYIDPLTSEVFPATVVLIQIDEATMEALAAASPTDAPIELHYDILVTPVTGKKFQMCYGTFTYYPGVTL